MEPNIEEMHKKISDVARKTIESFDEHASEEHSAMKRQVLKFRDEVEDIFKHFLGFVPGRVIDSVSEQTFDLLSDTIKDSRSKEKEGTIEKLGSVKAETARAMTEKLYALKDYGPDRDNSFELQMEEAMARVLAAYRKILDESPSRKGEDAFDEIRWSAKKTFAKLQDSHDEVSDMIKRDLRREIEASGVILTEEQIDAIDQKSKQGIPGLDNMVKSDEDVAKFYKSENEKAFKGDDEPKRDPNSKNKYESLFK